MSILSTAPYYGLDLVDASTPYYVASTINFPVGLAAGGVGLQTVSAGDWTAGANVVATHPMPVLLRLSSMNTVRALEIDGSWVANNVINADSTTGVTVTSSAISRSNKSSSFEGSADLLSANSAAGLTVSYNQLRRAGYDPDTQTGARRKAGAISVSGGDNVLVRGNNIAWTLTAGVDIGTSRNITVDGNVINQTGLGTIVYGDGTTADGITGYHSNYSTPRNVKLTDNVIENSYNHGIHVTGNGIEILRNTIQNTQGDGWHIRIADRLANPDCNRNIQIKNNPLQPRNHSIYIGSRHPRHMNGVPNSFVISSNNGAVHQMVDDTPHCSAASGQ